MCFIWNSINRPLCLPTVDWHFTNDFKYCFDISRTYTQTCLSIVKRSWLLAIAQAIPFLSARTCKPRNCLKHHLLDIIFNCKYDCALFHSVEIVISSIDQIENKTSDVSAFCKAIYFVKLCRFKANWHQLWKRIIICVLD